MNGRGFNPLLALVAVCLMLVFTVCPEIYLGLLAYGFIVVFLTAMVLLIPALFIFGAYCIYGILRTLWKILGGR